MSVHVRAGCLARLAVVVACALAVLGSATTEPRAETSYSSFYVLGDSFSDDGNLHRQNGGQVPRSPPYHQGRFSDGPVWFDRVAPVLAARGIRTGNFAYSYARAVADSDGIADLDAQRGLYMQQADRGAAPLVGIFMGTNDLLQAIGRHDAHAAARQAAREVRAAGEALWREAGAAVMLFNLPSLARIPLYAGRDPAAQRAARQATLVFNRRIAHHAGALRGLGAEVIEADMQGLLRDIARDPLAYGLDGDIGTACFAGGRRCSPEEAARRAFFDPIHPSAALHRQIGDTVLDLLLAPEGGDPVPLAAAVPLGRAAAAVVPVPLPATFPLVLVALAAGGALARRRRGGAPAVGVS